MSKSNPDARTRILLTDTIEQARDKLRAAVTDSEKAITYDPVGRPGVSNLLSMLAGLTDQSPDDLVPLFANKSMKDLKDAVGDALAPLLNSFQAEHTRLSRDPGYLDSIEAIGCRKASKAASSKMQAVRQCIGLDY